MLIYYGWRLYYCAPLVWASTLSLLAAAPLYLYGRQMLDEYQVTDESRALLLLATDYLLSATLLSGVLCNFLYYSLMAGFLTADRSELYLLRAISSFVTAAGAVYLVALLPRPVLVASTAVYLGVSLNFSCWWAAIWLQLQTKGVGAVLPPDLAHALRNERPIDWLRRKSPDLSFFSKLRQVVTLLLLPEEDLDRALALLPPSLRERLQRRGLEHSLPAPLSSLCAPWSKGPDYLRVRHVELLNGHSNGHSSNNNHHADAGSRPEASIARAPAIDAPRASAPEWLLLYALRRQMTRACLGDRATNFLGTRRANLVLAGGAAAFFAASVAISSAAGSVAAQAALDGSRRRRLIALGKRLMPSAAPVVLAAVGYLLIMERRRRLRVRE